MSKLDTRKILKEIIVLFIFLFLSFSYEKFMAPLRSNITKYVEEEKHKDLDEIHRNKNGTMLDPSIRCFIRYTGE